MAAGRGRRVTIILVLLVVLLGGLLVAADRAMYEVKVDGGGAVAIAAFSSEQLTPG